MNQQDQAMAPPSDSVTVEFKSELPEVFRQENRFYFKENMPNNPEDRLLVWYQPVDKATADKALQLRALKLAFESENGQIFI